MKKICMIVPKGLPLPAVKGGAIETIVTNVIKENEIQNKIDLTVVSIYDDEALTASKNYHNTKFIYIKKDLRFCLKSLLVHIKNLFHNNYNTYNEVVLDKIKSRNFDYIIVEDGAFNSFKHYLKYFKKEQMVLHFHHVGVGSAAVDETFDKFIAVSKCVQETFLTNTKLKNTYVLRNAIDVNNFTKKITNKELNALKNELGFSEDDYIVLYCGRVIKDKGIFELCEAINNLNNKIKLLIVGSSNFANGNADFNNLSNNPKIKFTGYIANQDVYKYYKLANVIVVPTKIEDAAPLVCLEALVCNLPIITTGTGGIKEYADKYALYIKNDQNLTKNIENAIREVYDGKVKIPKNNLDYQVYGTLNYYNKLVTLLDVFEETK